MNLEQETRNIITFFISGGQGYKVQVKATFRGSALMAYQVLKVWCAYKHKWVRISPYDLDLWSDCMDTDITKAIKEEL